MLAKALKCSRTAVGRVREKAGNLPGDQKKGRYERQWRLIVRRPRAALVRHRTRVPVRELIVCARAPPQIVLRLTFV